MNAAADTVADTPDIAEKPGALRALAAQFGVPGALVALSAATGFVAFPWAGSGYDARYALVAIAAACWLAAWALAPRLGWSGDPVLARAATEAGAVVLASTLLSPVPLDALFSEATTEAGAIHWLANLAVFVLAAALPFDRRVGRGLALAFAWVVPIAFVGFGQSLFGAVRTTLENADYFAAAMVLFVPLAFGFAVLARHRWVAVAWLAAAALLAIAIVTAGASSGFAGLAIVLLLLGAYAPRAYTLAHPVPGAKWAAAAIAAGLLALQVPQILRAVVAAPVVGPLVGVAGTTRANFWEAAARAFELSPLLGHGVDGYARAVQGFMPAEQFALESAVLPQYQLPADAHSAIWTILVLFGAVGFVVLAWLGWLWLRRLPVPWRATWRDVEAPPEPGADPAADLELVRACVCVGVLGYATVLLFVPMSLLGGSLLSLFAGLSVARVVGTVPASLPARRTPGVRTSVLVAAALLVLLGGVRAVDSAQLAWAVSTEDPVIQRAALDRSIAMEPFRAEIRFLRLLQEFSVGAESGDMTAFHEAVDAERPIVRDYAPYMAFLTMVSLTEAQGTGRTDVEWERATLERTRSLAPHLPMVKSSALQIAIIEGDQPAALEAIEVLKRDQVPLLYWKGLTDPEIGPIAP